MPKDLPQTPSLAEIISSAFNSRLESVYTAMPARVMSAMSSDFTVSIQPLGSKHYEDEDGNLRSEPYPVIPGVPVMFPGSGPYRITFPVEIGDTVLAVFSNSSTDRWKSVGQQYDQDSTRHHDLSDAIAIPGLLAPVGVVGNDTPVTSGTMTLHAPILQLGGDDADDPVVRRSDLVTVVNHINNHKHHPPNLSSGTYAVGTDLTSDTGTPTDSLTTPDCSEVVKAK